MDQDLFSMLFGEPNISPVERARQEALARAAALRGSPQAAPQTGVDLTGSWPRQEGPAAFQMPQAAPQVPQRPAMRPQGRSMPSPPPPMAAPAIPAQPDLNQMTFDAATKRRDALLDRQANMPGPDIAGAQAAYDKQYQQGGGHLLNALAAVEAGKDFQPMQAHFLKQAAEAQNPMKMAGGTMTNTGFVADPMHASELADKRLDGQIKQQDEIIARSASAAERARAEQEKARLQALQAGDSLAIRQGMLAVAQGGLDLRREGAAAKAGGKEAVESRATVKQSQTALMELDRAAKLVPLSTSSGIGAGLNKAMDFFGGTTDAADATAQLNQIAGYLTTTVPRMQGPQSDKDVLLYKQMAGDLAATVDPGRRLKLITQMSDMHRMAIAQAQGADISPPVGAKPGGGLPAGAKVTRIN